MMNLIKGKSLGVRWDSLITVFVDNLPVRMNQFWLRNIFSWYRNVVDAFIPNKRRKGVNSRFGFIRFETKEEALRAIFRLNGVAFSHSKLLVKLADYGWGSRNSNSSLEEIGSKDSSRYKNLKNWNCAIGYGLESGSPLSPSFNFGLKLAKSSQATLSND
ncbi:hypothetical protein L1049_020913 [Liquidambar formosana]|uniref:RRM domain-containing protein n=1 Tax=Liquidambar formosana TaxID=63359 RepID=A0AAP0X6I4_LIQFO